MNVNQILALTEEALTARLGSIAQDLEDAATTRAIDALGPKVQELVDKKARCAKPSIDPRTIVELIDQRLKEALDARFRAMLQHIEKEVIPRALKKYASGV